MAPVTKKQAEEAEKDPEVKLQWLRKRGTNEVFVRTPILAERSDMIAIPHSEAMRIRSGKVEPVKAPAQSSPKGKEPTRDPLDAMGEVDLRAKAADLKIVIEDELSVEEIRAIVRSTMATDEKKMADVKGNTAKAQVQPDPERITE
jgi:hypothetical protein